MEPRFRILTLAAVLAAPAWAQTPQEISLAGHVLRRVEYGANLGDFVNVLPSGTTSQAQQIGNYLQNQILLQNITQSAEHNNLFGPGSTVFPALLTDASLGWASQTTLPAQPANFTIERLAEANMCRALWSNFSLQEKMTQFWQRHFSTNWGKLVFWLVSKQGMTLSQARDYATYFEAKQNDLFRTNAMGSFANLLLASAEGEAMLIYLDGVDSGAPVANQNYGREFLELHTLGRTSFIPSGGTFVEVPNYSFQDILDIADIFSGWSLQATGNPVQFSFNFKPTGSGNGSHIATSGGSHSLFDTPGTSPFVFLDPTTGTFGPMVINHNLTARNEGLDLIAKIADSPITAEHISRKLYRHFVSPVDPPPFDPLIFQMVNAWRTLPGGNLQLVLFTLFTSNEFLNAPGNRWSLARTPLESMGQYMAVLDGKVFDANDIPGTQARITRLRTEYLEESYGQPLFRHGPPDGFPTDNTELITSLRLLGRTRLAQELYGNFVFGAVFLTGSFGVDYINTMAPFVNLGNEFEITNWWDLLWSSGDQPANDWSDIFTCYSTDPIPVPGFPPAAQTLLQALAVNLNEFIDQFTEATAFAAASPLNSIK